MGGTGVWSRVLPCTARGVAGNALEATAVGPGSMGLKFSPPPVSPYTRLSFLGSFLGFGGLVVAVPVLAVVMVVIRHVLQGEIYGDTARYEPAVLRATGEFRTPKTPTAA